MKFGKPLFASIALVASFGAQALTGTTVAGPGSSFLTLSAPGVCGICSLSGSVTADINGGSIVQDDQPFADIPKGAVPGGLFLSAGPSTTDPSTVSFTSGPVDSINFLWGSPDLYNALTVVTTLGSFAFDVMNLGFSETQGNQAFSQYVQFTAAAGESITGLIFSSSRDAFEATNFSVTTPVPEPETYVLMLAGIGAVGFMSRRRRRQA